MTLPANFAANPSMAPGHNKHIAHIDGIRALAILGVVFFHLKGSACPGGFTGVDVFFVISGFLITGGITKGLAGNTFTFTDFYLRRAKRILPAYMAVIAFVLLYLWFFKFPILGCQSISHTALYSLVYAANFYFYNIISYFDVSARDNPLLHLWSLSIEEQFYLVSPLLLWGLWKLKCRHFLRSLIVLFVASFVVSVLSLKNGHSQFAFYMLPSRAWELLGGAIFSQLPPLGLRELAWAARLNWVGAGLVLIPFFLLNDSVSFPGLAALPSICGCALLIRYGSHGLVNRVLASNPFVWIGKVSYSLYLWHWPIIVLNPYKHSLKGAIVSVAVTSVATYVSWRFIEEPVRRMRSLRPGPAFACAGVLSLVIAAGCLAINRLTPANGKFPEYFGKVALWPVWEHLRSPLRSECSYDQLVSEDKKVLVKIGDTNVAPTFVLWGDSHALAMLPGLDKVAMAHAKAGYYVNLKHNFTTGADIGDYPYNPRKDREPVLAWLETRHDLADVFLASRWTGHLKTDADVTEALGICRRLHEAGKHVYVFATVPEANPQILGELDWGQKIDPALAKMEVSQYTAKASMQTKLFAEINQSGIATILPINDAFLKNGAYYTATESQSFFLDDNHVNETGAIKAITYVLPEIAW